MSTRGNEWQAPEVSEPAPEAPEEHEPEEHEPEDADRAVRVVADGTDHHGRDDGRDTLTAGQWQREHGPGGVQDQPAMSQNNATDDEKLRGIVAQTIVDVGDRDDEDIAYVLRERVEQSGIPVTDDELADLVRRVRTRDV